MRYFVLRVRQAWRMMPAPFLIDAIPYSGFHDRLIKTPARWL